MKTPVFLVLAGAAAATACSSDGGGSGPKAEIAETEIKLDLPQPPDFPNPQPYADGSHPVSEMRLKGSKFLDQTVKVTGFVLVQYDLKVCGLELGDKAVKADPKLCDGKKDIVDCTQKVGDKLVAETPDKCDRPYFYLGDDAHATIEKAIWVVEVPRPLREDEKRDPMAVEAFKHGPPVPTIKVGDKIVVEGKWALKSPSGAINSDGLLVYAGETAAP